jgi:hypothetical protein
MAFAEYVARRSLAPGHVAETPYTLILPSLVRCEIGRERKTSRRVSMSGLAETLFYYSKRTFQVQTEPVPLDEALLLVEFLESVDDGQSFTFDPYGTPDARSSSAMVVISDDQGYTQQRFMSRGQGGATDYFEFSFGARQL